MALTPKQRAEQRRRKWLLDCYGITPEDFEKVMEYQRGVCYICLRPPKKVRLNVDHRHVDGMTRGLTCMRCNKLLALALDNAGTLLRASQYLRNPPAVVALGGERYGYPGRIGTKKMRAYLRKKKKAVSIKAIMDT